MTVAVKKVTISLAEQLLEFADAKAKREGTTRSGLIAQLITELRQREKDELAREGYQFYAKEADEFAETTMQLAHEVLDDDSPTR
jgi:metal-responsive CopG/Arc/MetJ family transcriptional regulator